ncbi:MAG: substrate-binding domain-containing protein [Sedimentisphaerales bacterium]
MIVTSHESTDTHPSLNTAALDVAVGDNSFTIQLTAQRLLSLGLRHLAYCGYRGVSWSKEREGGFVRKVVDEACQPLLYQQPRSHQKREWANERRILAEWLKSLSKPVGIMAANDDRGQEVIEVCRTVGIQVPAEAAEIGVDKDEIICEQANPPLSSLVRNYEEIGYEAAELLCRSRARENVNDRTVVIHPHGWSHVNRLPSALRTQDIRNPPVGM